MSLAVYGCNVPRFVPEYTTVLQQCNKLCFQHLSSFPTVPLAAPNISLLNMSSTSFEMNWTNIPWELHNGILLGYKIWIETMDRVGLSIVPNISVQTFSPNEFYKRMINMSKWTTYCVKVAGFTVVGDGVATVECTRTYEDGKILGICR